MSVRAVQSRDLEDVSRGGIWVALAQGLEEERARFVLWAPVALGLGISGYFALPSEPGVVTAAAPFAIALIVLAGLPHGTMARTLAIFLVLAAAGFFAAKLRVEYVRAPVLQKRLNNAAVTGTVERAEAREPRGARLTIRVDALAGLAADVRPVHVRVRTMRKEVSVKAGDRVSLLASLAPPARPALPGGFDFGRAAWFESLGAVGYTFGEVKVLPPSSGGAPALGLRYVLAVEAVRGWINARIQAVLPGETGAIAMALITGERGGISKATNDAYKNSGLYHILSISGLHMVVMAGAIFYSVRLLLAAIPGLALRFEIKKWAALAGIIGALLYLAVSGGAFATVRSAIMILIMFASMLLDRPAIALRNVALAAFVILAIYPESLFDAGFQMSFAAVAGLVAAYEEVRRRFGRQGEAHPILQVGLFFGGIILSTLVAGAAVAPFAAYHFHQSQQYAVLANLVAIPVCNFLVMPAALAALVLMPFGLEALALWPMGKGIDAMTWCAAWVGSLPGAVGHVAAMPEGAFALMVAGGLWLCLWQAHWRLLGGAAILGGLAMAPFLERPDVLIARGGELVAVRGSDGALSALPARQSKYELERWLEYDGDARKAADASRAAAFACDGSGCTARVKGVLLAVARHPSAVFDDCARAGIAVLGVPRPRRGCEGDGKIIDFFDVWREGTHALYISPAGAPEDAAGRADIRVDTVAAHRGIRPWAEAPPRHEPRFPVPRFSRRGAPAGLTTTGEDAKSNENLPRFAARPGWLRPQALRPEIEDDDGEADAGISESERE